MIDKPYTAIIFNSSGYARGLVREALTVDWVVRTWRAVLRTAPLMDPPRLDEWMWMRRTTFLDYCMQFYLSIQVPVVFRPMGTGGQHHFQSDGWYSRTGVGVRHSCVAMELMFEYYCQSSSIVMAGTAHSDKVDMVKAICQSNRL